MNIVCMLKVLYERKLRANENRTVETAVVGCPFPRHYSEFFRVVNFLSQKQHKDIDFRPPI